MIYKLVYESVIFLKMCSELIHAILARNILSLIGNGGRDYMLVNCSNIFFRKFFLFVDCGNEFVDCGIASTFSCSPFLHHFCWGHIHHFCWAHKIPLYIFR